MFAPYDYDDAEQIVEIGFEAAKEQELVFEMPLVRVPARNPSAQQESILVNPGGPGGSGIELALGFGPRVEDFFGSEVAAQFDFVGFDPRGVGQSEPIRCFETSEDFAETGLNEVEYPLSKKEIKPIRKAFRKFSKACRNSEQAKKIGPHMSTANVARDMDIIRASLGEEQLNFLGLSYGTEVGVTYANLFPKQVGAFVLSGVVDPVGWANIEGKVPAWSRLGGAKSSTDTLNEFFRQCDEAGVDACRFAPNAASRYEKLAERVLEEPIVVSDEIGEFEITYQTLMGFTLESLYSPAAYPQLASDLADLEQIAESEQSVPNLSKGISVRLQKLEDEAIEEPPNFLVPFLAVSCADSNNPRSYNAFYRAGVKADRKHQYFGSLWAWNGGGGCIKWPFADEDVYRGPFNAETANPVLITNPLYDAPTGVENAEKLRGTLPNSVLVTADVAAHTTLGSSSCADAIMGEYFLNPASAYTFDGYECPSEFNVFELFAGQPAEDESTAEALAEVTAERAKQESTALLKEKIELREKVFAEAGLDSPPLVTP